MVLMCLTGADLLWLCEELEVDVEKDLTEAEIRKTILASSNDLKLIENLGNRILRKRQERESIRQERQEREQKRQEHEQKRQQVEKEMAAVRKQIQDLQQLKAGNQQRLEKSVGWTQRKWEEADSRFQSKAEESSSTCESSTTFTGELEVLAANDALVAAEAVKGRSESDEVLCQQKTVETARPAANKLAQLPHVCVACNVSEVASKVKSTADPIDTSTHVKSDLRAEEKCQLDDAVESSSRDGELRSSRENNCIVQGSVRLSASLVSQERGDLVNHSDCAGKRPIRPEGMCNGQHKARDDGMKESSRRKRRRKKRRKDRNAVANVAKPKTATGAKSQGAEKRKVRSSLTTWVHQKRSGHRSKSDREACSARTWTQGTGQLRSLLVRRSFRSSACSTKKRKVAGRDEVIGSSDAVNRVRVESGVPGRKLAGDCNVLEELIVSRPFCCSLVARVAFGPRPPRVRLK
ncbi:uncharacterized protein [Dermacentor andersoni]|uniref:uncharacterized protein isoform X4 n=1 Tax=Dermacentor andersoni TaxID=34620 RepID=UPI0024176B9B|nr:neurofilament medium polypeptide-like [Dermacentor andersoni]